METKWKDMTTLQKVGLIITFVGAALILLAIFIPDLIPVNIDVNIDSTVAIAVMCVGEAMTYWEKKRKTAFILIGVAVISMACYLVEIFLL